MNGLSNVLANLVVVVAVCSVLTGCKPNDGAPNTTPSSNTTPTPNTTPSSNTTPTPNTTPSSNAKPSSNGTSAPGAVASTTLLSRIIVFPPGFNHPAVGEATVQAAKNAVNNLPQALRTKLDQSEARIIIAPNMIDRWPESIKDLPENDPAPTLAEQPGRIYGMDMCLYERPKKRGTTDLGPARAPEFLQLHVGDMCFQVLDDMMVLSKDPSLREAWNEDKKHIPPDVQPKVANFMKLDDWGPRETCAEMFGSMMGGRNENTDNLYKYFPRVKKWLSDKLGVTG